MAEDPGAAFDAHVRAEFAERSVDATMATMTDAPYVTHVPVLTGGHGRDEVRQFYATWFVGRWPADMQVTHHCEHHLGHWRSAAIHNGVDLHDALENV
jgi:hypothetical protein